MSKADTIAFEYAKENGTLGLDYNQIYDAVKHGYHQAEKDNELTWEDIQKIDVLIYAVLDEEKYKRYYTQDRDGDFYEEVLKRFKSYGKKEI